MTIYDQISLYNRDETREASEYMDRLADEHRKLAFKKLVKGLLFLSLWLWVFAWICK